MSIRPLRILPPRDPVQAQTHERSQNRVEGSVVADAEMVSNNSTQAQDKHHDFQFQQRIAVAAVSAQIHPTLSRHVQLCAIPSQHRLSKGRLSLSERMNWLESDPVTSLLVLLCIVCVCFDD